MGVSARLGLGTSATPPWCACSWMRLDGIDSGVFGVDDRQEEWEETRGGGMISLPVLREKSWILLEGEAKDIVS